jgi:hypothetical protein
LLCSLDPPIRFSPVEIIGVWCIWFSCVPVQF